MKFANMARGAIRSLFLGVPLRTRLDLWRRGFRGWTYFYYELYKNDVNDYLPDSALHKLQLLNGYVGRSIFRNKLLFELFFKEHLSVVPTLGWGNNGHIYTRTGEAASSDLLLEWLRSNPQGLIFKPFDGAEGRDIFHIKVQDDQVVMNGQSVDIERGLPVPPSSGDYLITPFIAQAPYAEAIFPHTANSLRIITMRPPNGEPFIPVAVHRFGTAASIPTDNSSRGGLVVNLDLETGRLSKAFKFPTPAEKSITYLTHHPDTGAAIEGVVVPHWSEVRDTLLEVVKKLPFLNYVGWDVVVTEQGYCVIEGNSGASLYIQVAYPYLRDARVRDFLKSAGILPE